MSARWIVRNRVLTPECGNGIWSRHRTRLGALITLNRILRFRYHSGFYTIPAVVILTSPWNLPNRYDVTVTYSIIDWERGVRGPDDHYGVGYESDAEIADALRRLQLPEDDVDRIEVSWRAHSVRVEIAAYRQATA